MGSMSSSQYKGHKRQGFALLATLWLIVAISAVALEISLQARERRKIAINISERGQALAAANAGIATTQARMAKLLAIAGGTPGLGMSGMVDANDPLAYADSALSEVASLGPGVGAYTVYVRDAGTLLSIYTLDEERWRLFLTGLGVDYGVADRLAQAIADWIDIDHEPRASGAERDDYISAGRLVLPSNGPLKSVSDLKHVMGMTPEIYALISPYLVFTPSSKVNVNLADPPVLRSLPGFTEDVVAAIMNHRYSRTPIRSMADLSQIVPSLGAGGGGSGQPPALQSSTHLLGFVTEEVFVSSVGVGPGGQTQATVQAVLRPSRTSGQQGAIQVVSRRSW